MSWQDSFQSNDGWQSSFQPALSAAEDILPSLAGGIERGAAGTVMILPDLINQAVAGPQMLYRGLTGREHDNSPLYKPLYSSEDMLQKLPEELRPHDPQTLLGKAAGFVGGVGGGAATMKGGQILNETTAPFYQSGRNQIMGDLLASKANDPAQAAANIQNAPEYVPGSAPVAGVASGDAGLMGLQRGVENLPTSEQLFKDRAAQQTVAQNQELNNLAGNASDIAKLQAQRDAATAPLYEQARNQTIDPSAIQPVISELDKKIALAGPQNDSGKLLAQLKAKIEAGLPSNQPTPTGILDANGNPITRPAAPTMQQPVIGTYRETRDALNLKGMQPGALGAEVRSNVAPANKLLGQALESQSPSFAQAQSLYKQGSVPINQLEAGQAIKEQIQTNSPNSAGQLPISQPRLQQILENGLVKYDGKEMPIAELATNQQQGLGSLQKDLNRNMLATGARVKPTPSTELNNLATSSPVMKLISHIPWVKGISGAKNTQLQQQLAQVLLDNPRAAKLILGSKTPNPQVLGQILMQAGINGSGQKVGQ